MDFARSTRPKNTCSQVRHRLEHRPRSSRPPLLVYERSFRRFKRETLPSSNIYLTHFNWHDGVMGRTTTRSAMLEACRQLLEAHDMLFNVKADLEETVTQYLESSEATQHPSISADYERILEDPKTGLATVILAVEQAAGKWTWRAFKHEADLSLDGLYFRAAAPL
jgi:hypothetical protein